MAEYRHRAQAVFDWKYHVVWCTKNRYKIPRGRVAERAGDLIRQIWENRDIVIVRGAVSPDHVHLLLSAPPVLSPAKVAQYIKGRSSRHLQAEFPELRKRYWGQHTWHADISVRRWARLTKQRSKLISKARSGTKTIKALKSPRRPSLQPALSRTGFRRLQPPRDFQSPSILPALSR